jgi:hypothetical protein
VTSDEPSLIESVHTRRSMQLTFARSRPRCQDPARRMTFPANRCFSPYPGNARVPPAPIGAPTAKASPSITNRDTA